MKILPMLFILFLSRLGTAHEGLQQEIDSLRVYPHTVIRAAKGDWLLDNTEATAEIFRSKSGKSIILTNGLIARRFRLVPYMGCFSFSNLKTGEQLVRAIEPEARLTINGHPYNVGGARGQFERAYLRDDWLSRFTDDPDAFQLTGFTINNITPRFPWKPTRWVTARRWPPKGKEITFHFRPPESGPHGVTVEVHYNLYDNIPLISKWISVTNNSGSDIRIDSFESELLAMVENGNGTQPDGHLAIPHIFVESDYSFGGMDANSADHTTFWMPDTLYKTQVNYEYKNPCLLESKPPIGPWYRLASGMTFNSFRTYELVYDNYDKERCGLAQRRMYRVIAPWVTENPIFLHLTTTDPAKVKAAINQCADVGFEMVILSFGSGLNMEDTSAANIGKFKDLVDYARRRGIELGGYSLFSSRNIDDSDDVINPKTGRPGGQIFGYAPCLGSKWGIGYLKRLKTFIARTGFQVLENDGPYPGDICASTTHPGHEGMLDSQWKQWHLEISFYRWLRARDIYLNAPDWYFLNGSNKTAMGYRETDWSLPREQQIIIERQNIYDGTWYKTPSMGWMFVPLVQYHGGGAAATIEPLHEHLKTYATRLFQNFSSGVQACYRGPRLFDTPATEKMVKGIVSWYKTYRTILNSDIIHLRRADGRDWDGVLHVNPRLTVKGLAVIYNPLDKPITRRITLPLYYTGLKLFAKIRVETGKMKKYNLSRTYSVNVTLTIPARGHTWLVIE